MVANVLPFWLQDVRRGPSMFPAAAEAGASRVVPPFAAAEKTVSPDLFATRRTVVEACTADAMAGRIEAWRMLVGRALEPNVFMEPGFALPAARHLSRGRRPTFLLVWHDEMPGLPRLVGLCAIRHEPARLGGDLIGLWTHPQATCSAPVLDRGFAGEALAALLDWLQAHSPRSAGLLVSNVDLHGPFAALLNAATPAGSRLVEQRSRAVLTATARQPAAAPVKLSSKRTKELRRQQRRLAESGVLALRSATGGDAVRAAVEQFLELEARGWKGARRTALVLDPATAAFTRTMTRVLAREGKCAVHSLDLDGRPIAMGIVLRSGDRAYFWKTAYDEQRGKASPGRQFAQALTDILLSDEGIALTDSCAIPDHPMIDRVWPERMTVADLAVMLPSAQPAALSRAVLRLQVKSRLRKAAKALVALARRRFRPL